MWGPWRSLDHRCIIKNKPVNNTKSPPQSTQMQRGLLVNSIWLLDAALSALRVKKAKDLVIANIIMRLCPTNLMFSKHFASINHPPSRARWGSSLRARYRPRVDGESCAQSERSRMSREGVACIALWICIFQNPWPPP